MQGCPGRAMKAPRSGAPCARAAAALQAGAPAACPARKELPGEGRGGGPQDVAKGMTAVEDGQPQDGCAGVRLSPPEGRLLLLAAHLDWTAAQRAIAEELAGQVTQWPALVETAWRKFVVPTVYANLATLRQAPPPAEVLELLRGLSLRVTADMLHRRATFEWVHSRCILPSGAEHAYFKGPALAARFYPDPMQRFFRDIDVLVPARDRFALLRRMMEQGCRPFLHKTSGVEFLRLDRDRDLRDYLALNADPHVLTPQGMVVEVHREVDPNLSLFDTDALLRRAGEVTLGRHRLRILADDDHITFLCYHHTRHLWSKLAWLADLDAVFRHAGADRAAVLAAARRANIESTVAAAMELHDLASAGRLPGAGDPPTPGTDLLRACLDGLHGDMELEEQMRRGQRFHALAFDWQGLPLSPRQRAALFLRRLRPNYDDVRALSASGPLRYPAAMLLKALRAPLKLAGRPSSP